MSTAPFPPSYTMSLCTLTRSRAVELPIDPRRFSYSPFFSTPSASATNTPPPAPPSTRLPTPTGGSASHSPAMPSSPSTSTAGTTPSGHHGTTNSAAANNPSATPSTNMSIPIREISHTTHPAYILDIARRPALELSALRGTFHWRALALVRRAVVFHTALLKLGDAENARKGAAAGGRKRKRNSDGAGVSLLEQARAFADPAGDVAGDLRGVGVTIAPSQLLRLKTVVGFLTPDRVLGTMKWIEDHEMTKVAINLEMGNLLSSQSWCASCHRTFCVVAPGEAIVNPQAATKDPMGIHGCGHVMCKSCVVNWLHDVVDKGRKGTQPCCAFF
ncbi:hypothetical protein SLS58_006412 [Diplodia intermedia]|uniref:RING-type domain-containing protein n=1 Tax=Diplodia intermedia TaxID=856260 RepID=A0ABR3TN82_9PEZI